MIIVFIISLLLFLIILALALYISFAFALAKMVPDKKMISDSLARNEYPEDMLNMKTNIFNVKSQFGYNLYGEYINNYSDKTVIFVHGVTTSIKGMYKYYSIFENAWNIIGYDHRGHGKSGGGLPSYGVFEKHDLKNIVDWAYSQFPGTKKLLVYGESMGAAVTLQYLELDNRPDLVIADSPFTSLKELSFFHIKRLHLSFLKHLIFFLANVITRLYAGYFLSSADPSQSLGSYSKPILFIHSTSDKIIPYQFSEKLSSQCTNSELLLIDGADHTLEIVIDRQKYVSTVKSFIKKYIQGK